MNFREAARRANIGKLSLRLWHQPLARVRDSLRNGGPIAERATERGRAEMEGAAAKLAPLPERAGAAQFRVHLLTGRRFWYQSAFCLHSLSRASGCGVGADIYDDGTLDDRLQSTLRRLVPAAAIHTHGALTDRLDALLPESRFPVLRERWRNYPNIRTLIDPHLGYKGWKLVIDSDLLFFRRPSFLIDWILNPDRPVHGVDCEESYGYSRSLMERLAGAPVPPLVNTGLCGMKSESIDWCEVEAWCAELIAREKKHYFLSQAIVAMLLARSPTIATAPAKDYVTKPDRHEALNPRAVMHHYVAESKRWYFGTDWRLARDLPETPIERSAHPG